MPTLPVFENAAGANQKDPDSKRYRGSHRGSCRRCLGTIDVRWLAIGFVLGMLVFGGLSMLQSGDGEPRALLRGRATGESDAAPADTEYMDTAEGMEQHDGAEANPEQPQDGEAAAHEEQQQHAEHSEDGGQPEGGEQPADEQPATEEGRPEEQGAESEQPADSEQPVGVVMPGEGGQGAESEQPANQEGPGKVFMPGVDENPAVGEAAAEDGAAEQQRQEAAEGEQQEAAEAAEQQQSAMSKLHAYGIRYSEREPGTPAVGGEVFVGDSDWGKKGGRRVLIYLGVDTGAELDYVINVDRDERQKEYDIAFVFDPRVEHNEQWRSVVRERSNPVVEYWNKAAWMRNTVMDFGNDDRVGSVLRTRHNNFDDEEHTIQVHAIDFSEFMHDFIRDNDDVTLVADIQGAEFPVFSHLVDTALARRINTLYLECHYEAHAALLHKITEDSCRELCRAIVPQVPDFWFWVGPNKERGNEIVRGFEFVNQPGLGPGDCDSLHIE